MRGPTRAQTYSRVSRGFSRTRSIVPKSETVWEKPPGFTPGDEFRIALAYAERERVDVVLGDSDVVETLGGLFEWSGA